MSEFDAKVENAKARVAEMDKVDGFKDRHLRTILFALAAGLQRPETNSHYDAYVMLADKINNEV